ncbi:MAG TPA: type II secretion system protein N [Steroidobacteraceae bacterium]|nr:type II secretion system protein N [Steroidobacteraceae bacterium]
MSRKSLLIAAGIAAFLVFMVAMIPARQLAGRLPSGVELQGVGGTIWSGRASGLAVNGAPLGALQWSCRPWRLFVLEWSCRVNLRPRGGDVSADLSGGLDGEVLASGIAGRVPISAFEGIATPRGWSGNLELDVQRLRIVEQRPTEAVGQLFVRSLKAPGPRGELLGDFELTVGEGTVGTETLSGRLRDLGGPLRVRGAIELRRDGSYLLSGEVAPGPGAGPAIFDTLAFLGPPDDLGRRPFAIEGTL